MPSYDFNLLFDIQLKTLLDRGCPRSVIDELRKQRFPVLSKAADINLTNNRVIFVPVVSFSETLTPSTMMQMVFHGSRVGYSYLTINDTFSLGANGRPPYYIFEVDDGILTDGMTHDRAEGVLRRQGRRFLRPQELVASAIQKPVFLEYNWIAGEPPNGNGHYADLFMDGGAPSLSLFPKKGFHRKWAYPSCSFR